MRTKTHWAVVLPVLATLLCAGASPARAMDWDWFHSDGDPDDSAGIALAVITSIVHTVYVAGDIGYGAKGRWLPPGWAWTQTIWGGLNLSAAAIMVPLGALGQDASWLGLGIATGLLGTWFFIHGVVSLVKHYTRRFRERRGPPPPPGIPPAKKFNPAPSLSLAPTRGGAYTALTWQF